MTRGLSAVALAAVILAFALSRDAAAQSYPLPALPALPALPPPPTGTSRPLTQPLPVMSPFPVVRIVGRLTRDGARIQVLSVRAPASSRIFVRCFRRGCRGRSATQGRGRRPVRFRRFERQLPAGTMIEVRVGRSDAIGKYTRFRIRRGRRPARQDLCLDPGASRGTVCPER